MRLSSDDMLKIKMYFFNEGVCLVEDRSDEPHPELNICNNEVKKMFKSLVSRGIARKVFVWRHSYFFLTPAGIDMLREELCLEEQDMPRTHVDTTHGRMEQVENVIAKGE
ncbi:40s ribosomal protein s10 [Pseudoloma neurophilia]|uniref:40s ribosomal protein s10 n=1 Tax=Pseudoloma neurophilia TaxID=146866 RepID=A0A0R0M508_9MICR|nr:40s ribosomal protein s10 [Pseudoloma neurophilia]